MGSCFIADIVERPLLSRLPVDYHSAALSMAELTLPSRSCTAVDQNATMVNVRGNAAQHSKVNRSPILVSHHCGCMHHLLFLYMSGSHAPFADVASIMLQPASVKRHRMAALLFLFCPVLGYCYTFAVIHVTLLQNNCSVQQPKVLKCYTTGTSSHFLITWASPGI